LNEPGLARQPAVSGGESERERGVDDTESGKVYKDRECADE
jgi:hypothetical protein